MGNFTSKLASWTSDNSSSRHSTGSRKSTVIIEDPRSPTEGVNRTPIIVDKSKPYLETSFDGDSSPVTKPNKPLPLRKLILKRSIPDSKTSTINLEKTSLLTDKSESLHSDEKVSGAESPVREKLGDSYFDSPISNYSCMFSQMDSVIDITEPIEPSAIVSDFEHNDSELADYQEIFLQQIDNLIDKLKSDISEEESVNSGLNKEDCEVFQHERENQPEEDCNVEKKGECEIYVDQDLLIEYTEHNIHSNTKTEENKVTQNKILTVESQADKIEKQSSKSNIPKMVTKAVSIKKEKVSPQSKIPIVKSKPRTPLANITSSANSPRQVIRPKTHLKNQSTGVENNSNPYSFNQRQIIGDWDQDNTVII